MLANPAGEKLALYNGFTVDATTVLTKTFPCNQSIAIGTEIVAWNGLVQDTYQYIVKHNSIVFNADIPLMIGDRIGIKYFIGE